MTGSGFPQAQSFGGAHQIGERLDAHLLHDVRAVQLDILFPGAEVGRNLFIELPGDDVLHDFALARREGGQAGGQGRSLRDLLAPGLGQAPAPARTARTNAAASTGLVRKSVAPALIARTLMGMSP